MKRVIRQTSWITFGDTPGPPQVESRYGKAVPVPLGTNSTSSTFALSTCGLNDKHDSLNEFAEANWRKLGIANIPWR
jgi:hypothetical protein